MKTSTVILGVLLASTAAVAQTAQTIPVRKPCDELKAEIAKKIEAHSVSSYSLEIVDRGKESEGKVVGTCDGGTKSIVYSRTAPAPPAQPQEASKPQ